MSISEVHACVLHACTLLICTPTVKLLTDATSPAADLFAATAILANVHTKYTQSAGTDLDRSDITL